MQHFDITLNSVLCHRLMMKFYPYFLLLGVRILMNSCIIRALPSYAHLWEGGRISRLEGVIVLILR